MKDELARYTLRVERALLEKLAYVARYEGRTAYGGRLRNVASS